MSLFPDVQPNENGGSGIDWSYFPAQHNVNLSGFQISNGSAAFSTASATTLTVGTINGLAPNSGIMALNEGAGISLYGADPQRPTIENTGVLTVSAGPGIGLNGATTTPTITNTGLLGVSPGTGIGLVNPSSQTPTITNTGVLTVSAGANITVGGTAQNPIISAVQTSIFNTEQVFVLEPPFTGLNLTILYANRVIPIRCASSGATVTLPNPNGASPPIPAGTWFIISNTTGSGGIVTVSLTGLSYSVTLSSGQSCGFITYTGSSGTVGDYCRFC